jgi:hypothetical protein
MALNLAQIWLKECFMEHKACRPPQYTILPKRTIFVGLNNDHISLSENDHNCSRFYTCLSHCWGGFQPLTTTRQSLAAHKQGISWNSLPKTFQDAIDFSRRIGIFHIWIDSLCIIQDDEKDWALESSKMATIFSNAFLTIGATASQDARGGCFREQTGSYRKPLELGMSIFARPNVHGYYKSRPFQNECSISMNMNLPGNARLK